MASIDGLEQIKKPPAPFPVRGLLKPAFIKLITQKDQR